MDHAIVEVRWWPLSADAILWVYYCRRRHLASHLQRRRVGAGTVNFWPLISMCPLVVALYYEQMANADSVDAAWW